MTLLNKFACCLLGDDAATKLSKEAENHLHPHPVACIGPPSWAPKPLLPSSTTDPNPRSHSIPGSSRQSISYPTFGSDSFDASEDETPAASPEKTRNSLQRFHNGIVKRLSHSSPPAGSQGKSNDSQNTRITPESIERRKELKRALHRRVEEELLQDKTERPEKKQSSGALAKGCQKTESSVGSATSDPQPSRPKHRPTGSMGSKKSLKSMLDGLPTVAEHPDATVAAPSKDPVDDSGKETDEDRKSAAASSWYTDKPSTEALSKKTSQVGIDGAHLVQAPEEPIPKIPELPEVFAKLKKTYARRSASINGDESIYRSPYALEKKVDNNKFNDSKDNETAQAVDDIFKPLDHSPQRLGLWTRKSIDKTQASSKYVDTGAPSFGHDGPMSTETLADKPGSQESCTDERKENGFDPYLQSSPPGSEDQTKKTPTGEAKPSPRNEPDSTQMERASSTNLRGTLKRMLGSSLVGRLWKTGHDDVVVPAMSLPSLRNGETSHKRDNSPMSFLSFRTAPADLHGSRLRVRSRVGNTLGESSTDSKIDDDDPFVEKQDINQKDGHLDVPSPRRRSRHHHSTSIQSDTESFRAREIAAVSKRIVSQRWKDHPGRKSRFKEMLGVKTSEAEGPKTAEYVAMSPFRGPFRSFDGPEDPEPKIKRSYTVSDYIKAQNSAGTMWERALQEHAFEMALKNSAYRRKNTGIGQSASKSAILTSRDKGKSPAREDMRTPIRRHKSELEEISPGASPAHSLHHKPSKDHLKPASPLANTPSERSSIAPGQILGSASTPDSWARFPSHTRPKRTGAAGAADSISSFDFGNGSTQAVNRVETVDIDPLDATSASRFSNDSPQGPAVLGPVIAFPARILKLASQMRKTVSMDIRRSARRGMRSSVSTGSRVKAPELELLGLSSPTLTTISDADAKELEKHSASMSYLPRRSDPSDEEFAIGHPPAIAALPSRRQRSTRVLTKMYQDLARDSSNSPVKNRDMTLPTHKARRRSQIQSDGSVESPPSPKYDEVKEFFEDVVPDNERAKTPDAPITSHVKEVVERLEKRGESS